jgi:hypothetical protein
MSHLRILVCRVDDDEAAPMTAGHVHELRTACLVTATAQRYLCGTGDAFLNQVLAAVLACFDCSLLVIADGARWIRAFIGDYLAGLPNTRMLLDWLRLKQKCHALASGICPGRLAKAHLLRLLDRRLWAGQVPGALRLLEAYRLQVRNVAALEELRADLAARAEWIPLGNVTLIGGFNCVPPSVSTWSLVTI